MDLAKRKMCVLLLLEEEEEEEILFESIKYSKKCKRNELFLNRTNEGVFKVLIEQRLFGDEQKFREYFRLNEELFTSVLAFVEEDIKKDAYNRHKFPISAQEKLCITLRYMATGESLRSLAFQFRIHHSWISKIVKQVLGSITHRMLNVYIPKPTIESLQANAQDYYDMWNFPNCCASIDGKHIRIQCPDNAGSLFFNYKNFYSIVLLAVVDAKYRFVAIDVGSYGREGDAGIFIKSNMGKQITEGHFNMPPPRALPGTNTVQPFVILGDEAFALTTSVMKPYPQDQAKTDKTKSVYNYRHCRARRTSENAFGILCQTFRVFHTPIAINPETANDLIISACILHNMLRNSRISYPEQTNERSAGKLPTDNIISLTPSTRKRSTFQACDVRNRFRNYFNSRQGTLPWQNVIVDRLK